MRVKKFATDALPRSLTISVVLSALMIWAAMPCAAQLTPAATARAQRLVVMVQGDLESGGVSIGAGIVFARAVDRLYVVTAYHVVNPPGHPVRRIRVAFNGAPDRWLPATIGQADQKLDMEVLTVSAHDASVDLVSFDFLTTTEDLGKLRPGVVAYAMGQGDGRLWDTTLKADPISRTDDTTIEIQSLNVAPGHSGGALLDTEGDLLGMVLWIAPRYASALRYDVLLRRLATFNYPVALIPHATKASVKPELVAVAMPNRIRFYRTYLVTIFGERQYIGEVDPTAAGHVYSVMSDDQGRVAKVVALRDGQTLSELAYHYAGTSTRPQSIDSLSGGQRQSTTRIDRNDQGYRTREEFLRNDGSRSGYNVYRYDRREVEITNYTEGRDRPSKRVREFSPAGVMKMERTYTDDGRSSYETAYDSATGLQLLRTKITDGRVDVVYRPTTDKNGDLVREDFFTYGNVWFGYFGYSQGLIGFKFYRFTNRSVKEIAITYDISRRPREAKLSVNGALICILRAEYNDSGRFVRTLAASPTGEVWAEYPGVWVNEITQDGRALDGARTVLHRTGNWW
jgi:Trypsin-like peptidase domain